MAGYNLGEAYIQIIPTTDGIGGAISEALGAEADSAGSEAGSGFGSGFLGSASSLISGGASSVVSAVSSLANSAVGAASSFWEGANAVAEYGDNIDKSSQKLGISAQAYQEWDAVLQHSGTSIDSMGATFRKLSTAIQDGSADQQAAFSQLGISMESLQSMSTEDAFKAVVTGLQGMEEGTERTALATELLGRGAMELGPLFNTSSEDTQAMIDRVNELGGVMSDEAVKDAASFEDQLQDMNTAIEGVSRNIMAEFLPSFSGIMDGIAKIVSGDEGGFDALKEGISSMVDSAMSAMPEVLEIGASIIESVATAIFDNLPILVEALPSLLDTVGSALIELLPTLGESLLAAASTLGDTIGELFSELIPYVAEHGPELLEGLIDGISAAGDVLLSVGTSIVNGIVSGFSQVGGMSEAGGEVVGSLSDGILSMVPGLITTAADVLTGFITGLSDALPMIVDTGLSIITNLINSICSNLPAIASAGVSAISSLLQGLVSALPSIIEAAIEIVGTLAASLIENLPSLLDAAITLLGAVPQAVSQIDWPTVGLNIIEGILKGLLNAGEKLINAILKLMGSAVDAVKNFFGIASPSKLMRDEVGVMLGRGMAIGITNSKDAVLASIDDLSESALGRFNASLDAGSMTVSGTLGQSNAEVLGSQMDELTNRLNTTLATLQTNVNVTLEGDAEGVFNLVRRQNNYQKRATGRSAFA